MAFVLGFPFLGTPGAPHRSRKLRQRVPVQATCAAFAVLLGACDSSVMHVEAPAPLIPPSMLPQVLAQVRVEFDPAAGHGQVLVMAPWSAASAYAPAGDRAATSVAAAVEDVNIVQDGPATCPECNKKKAGTHVVSVPLRSMGIFTNLSVSNPTCGNCTNSPPPVSPIPTEAIPDDKFTVSVTVEVKDSTVRFQVNFAIVGNKVEVKLCLTQAGFGDDYPISLDGVASVADPVWVDSDCDKSTEEKEPIAYASGTSMNLDATLHVAFEPQLSKSLPVKIVAQSTAVGYPMKFTYTGVVLPGGGGTVTLASASGDAALPAGKAAVVHMLGIQWSYTISTAPDELKGFATSSHPLYVTYRAPLQYPLYLTVLDLSTRRASGKQTDPEVVTAIWGEFSDKEVYKRTLSVATGAVTDSALLSYYKEPSAGACQTVEALLQQFDAQCDAWAKFLKAMLAYQGISSNIVRIQPAALGVGAFLVKNWTFPAMVSDPCQNEPWTFKVQHLTATRVPSQGNPNPDPADGGWAFGFHYLVEYKPSALSTSTYYDPSFGTSPQPSVAHWEAEFVDGFVLTNGCIKKNGATQELSATVS